MPKFNVTRRVPYSAEQVFDIAADVSSYRHFLPLVKKSVVRNRRALPDGREVFEAELHISYNKLGIREIMTSQVVIDPERKLVEATSADGPIKELRANWRIDPAGDGGSEIMFDVDYTLKSRSLQFILSGMFDMVVRRIMSAFEARVREVYGPSVAAS